MTIHRTRALLQAALWVGLCTAQIAWSQPAWRPEKNVEVILGTAAGGINDRVVRVMQNIFQEQKLTGVPVLPINKPGGNQTLAVVYLNQHAADPHYLLYSTPTPFTNEIAGITKLRYTDLTAVALLFVEYTVILVRNDSPMKSMGDLINRLKVNPEALSFALGARGGVNHMGLSQAVRFAGINPQKLKVAVFKTSGETLTALAGGHVDAVASSVSAAFALAQGGTVRMLAVAAPQRIPGAMAHVPTFRDGGLEVSGISNWRALFGPKGITPAQVAFWEEALAKVVTTGEWQRLVEQNNLTSHFLRSKEAAAYLEREYTATKTTMVDLGLAK